MEAFDDLRASFANALPGRSWISGYVSDFIEWTPTASNGNLVRDELRKSGLWRVRQVDALTTFPHPVFQIIL